MSLCEYCGEKAGWFQSNHQACVANANSTEQTVKELVFRDIVAGKTLADLLISVQQILNDNKVKEQYVRDALQQAVNDGTSQVAVGSPVSLEERLRLQAILTCYDVNSSPEKQWFGPAQVEMSHILWLVLNNFRFGVDFNADFNLQSGEDPIFQTANCVTYAEERTISNHTRTFGGLSLPVGCGVYYHIGGLQGHQERTSGLQQIDGGKMLITSHAIYFGGQETTLRIALDRILRYQPYVDGIGVCESHGAPKVFTFDYRGMDVGWFFYNLLSALTNHLMQKA